MPYTLIYLEWRKFFSMTHNFGTEEVKKYDEIIKKAGKFKFLGAQMVQILAMGLAPPALIRAEVRPSGRHQEVKTKP